MNKTIDVTGKITDSATLINDITLFTTNTIHGITTWLGKVSYFEIFLVVLIVVMLIILFYLRSKINKDKIRPKHYN